MLARKGNEEAFRRLYREIYDPVASYVNRRVKNTADAEDLTADIFHKFLMRLDSYDSSKGSVLTWIVSMARHGVIDHYRRKNPVTLDSHELADVLAGNSPGVLQSLIQDENQRRVRTLLLKQPAEIREMFELRYGQGLRVREVAEVMGIGPDAAKQRFARTLKKFQLELKDDRNISGSPKGENSWAVTD